MHEHAPLSEQRPDLLRIGAEAAQVAQAVDRLGAPPGGVLQQLQESQVVVVDAAEDGDARVRTLDRRGIVQPGRVGAQGRLALSGSQPQAGPGGGLAEVADGDQLLPPGRHAAVGGELGPRLARLLVEILGRTVGHPDFLRPAAHAVDVAGPAGRVLQGEGAQACRRASRPSSPTGSLTRIGQTQTPWSVTIRQELHWRWSSVPSGNLPFAQALPALVGAAALGLGADPEDRQHLEPRALDPHRPQQREEALLARVGRRASSQTSVTVITGLSPAAWRLRMPARMRSKVPSPRMGSLLSAS